MLIKMSRKINLSELIKEITVELNAGEYVFSTVKDLSEIDKESTVFEFK